MGLIWQDFTCSWAQTTLAQSISSQTVHCSRVHRLFLSLVCAVCQSRPRKGRNRKWVQEENLLEVVWWNDDLHQCSGLDDVNSRRSQRKEWERQGSSPAHVRTGFGKMQGSNTVRAGYPDVVRKTPASSLNPDEQVEAAQIRVTMLEAAIQTVGEDDPATMGVKEALQRSPHPSVVAAGLRPDKSHRGISEPVPEGVGNHDVRCTEIERGHHRIGVKNPG